MKPKEAIVYADIVHGLEAKLWILEMLQILSLQDLEVPASL